MKTKLNVEILSQASMNDGVIRMIASHNSGIANVDIDLIEAHLRATKAIYPLTHADLEWKRTPTSIYITEAGKQTLTVTEREIPELENAVEVAESVHQDTTSYHDTTTV